jgi:hypothetical protein
VQQELEKLKVSYSALVEAYEQIKSEHEIAIRNLEVCRWTLDMVSQEKAALSTNTNLHPDGDSADTEEDQKIKAARYLTKIEQLETK